MAPSPSAATPPGAGGASVVGSGVPAPDPISDIWSYSLDDPPPPPAPLPPPPRPPLSVAVPRAPFASAPSSFTLGVDAPTPAVSTTALLPPDAPADPLAPAAADQPAAGQANGSLANGHAAPEVTAPFTNPEKQTVSGGGKLMYLEGLRGLAAFFVMNGHFVDATFRKSQPQVADMKPFNLLWGGGWSVTLFFILSGRVITASFLRSAYGPKPRFSALASAVFRRPFRLLIPCAAAALIQWQVAAQGATQPANEAGVILGSPDMKTPGWSLIRNFGEYVIFCFNLLGWGNADWILVRGSTLWTIPYEYWGSNFIYLMTLCISLLPMRRWMMYAVLITMNWWTYNYNFMFAIGLLLADLDVEGLWDTVRRWKWYYLVALEFALMGMAAVVLWVPQISNPIDYGVLPHQLYRGTMGAQVNWHGITTSLWLSATLVMVWAEICRWGQWVLETWPFEFLGKISFGLYLIHETVLFTIVPLLVIDFNAMGLSFWPMIAACYFIYAPICFVLAWIFHLFIDEPSIFIGKWLWEMVTSVWPETWADFWARTKATLASMGRFYKRAAYTMVTCGCAERVRKAKQARKAKKEAAMNGEVADANGATNGAAKADSNGVGGDPHATGDTLISPEALNGEDSPPAEWDEITKKTR